ncbi:hypothetical protein [Bradyrhizobium sp. dw_78]|uniref:hypothetical protein n=1 Tax=Bradyrhizobium sp. dw_78 TaxID=2719793 RepID=UPI001BD6997E|nr:hypothetical protein [Bradyrhizobium sp. dw_78]
MSDTDDIELEPVETGIDTERADLETKARRLGWVPLDEFKGDHARWRDADEFMRRGETILPIVQENNRVLHDKLTATERQMTEMRQVLGELHASQKANEDRIRAQARAELENEMRVAVQTADTQRFEAANARLREVERPAAPVVPQAQSPMPGAALPPGIDPYVERWMAENTWMQDPALSLFAQAHSAQLMQEKPGLGIQDRLADVKRRVQDQFPEKFGLNPRRNEAASVAFASAPPVARRSNKRGYDDLPGEAKAACDRFVKIIPGYKREDYLKSYEWE